MILREITVKGVKCFRDECRVGPFGEGLNMIFGPNETGKSTLIEATARALFDGYTVTGDAIESLRPWGTSLAPEITLEFEARNDRWRLEKRLLSGASCTLKRMESAGWSLMHERDAADDFVRELLHGEAPGRGASDLRHWGLARTLWCLNDPCMIGRAEGNRCVVPGAVASQLRAVLGEGAVGTALEPVMERVVDLFETHFTPTTARPRSGSPIAALTDEIERLEDALADATTGLEEVEEAARRLEELGGEAADLEQERERLQEQIESYREDAAEVEALQREIKSVTTDLQREQADLAEIEEDLTAFHEARDAAGEARDKLDELSGILANTEAELRAARRLVDEAEEAHSDAQAERKRIAADLDRGRAVQQALSLLAERNVLNKLLADIGELHRKRESLVERLNQMPCPSDVEIERAGALEGDLQRLQAQLEAAGLSVTVEAHREQEISLGGGEEDLCETLGEGEEIEYAAGASLTIDLPEVARIFVRSGASEPAQLQADLEEAREQLRSLLAPYAADSSAALRDLQREYERLAEDRKRLEERIADTADPWKTPEQVRDRQAEIRLELTRRLNELDLSENELGALDRASLDELEDRFRSAQQREDEAQTTLNGRRERAEALVEDCETLRDRRSTLEGLARENETTAGHLLRRYECENDADLRDCLEGARGRVETLAEALAERQEQLPPEEADPRRLIETAEKALADVSAREIELAGKRGDNEGIIERARTEGRYEQLTQIEENLTTARRRLHETWGDAQAVKLLRRIIERRRSDVAGGALPGLEERISAMFRHVTGRRRTLQMDDDMRVSAIVDGETRHAPAALSSGTREQLDLVTRLALGATYAEHYGRTMLVLDDALLYTDPRRHDRIKQVLQRAGDLLQIFILTSHPERYRGIVPEDCRFDLEAVRTGAR